MALEKFCPGYLTGVALIAASVSMLIGKMDKLATTLLGVMLLLIRRSNPL